MANNEGRKSRIAYRQAQHERGVSRIFLAILALFLLINLIVPSRTFSEMENRNLAQRPKLTGTAVTDGSFEKDFDSYYADQFVLRDLFMQLKFYTDFVQGKRKFQSVFIGKDGYLLSDPAVPDADAEAAGIAAINAFAAKYPDVDMTALIAPGAASVLTDKLPSDAATRDQIADIQEYTSRLDERIRLIPAAETLLAGAGGEEQIYYRTDHHWTSEGAYQVFQASVPILDVETDGISYKKYLVSDSFRGTLASQSGDMRHKDEISVYIPTGTDALYTVNFPDEQIRRRSMYFRENLDVKDQYTVFFGGNHSLVEIETTVDNDRSILIFKDSYVNCFIQFLIPYYHRITMIDPRYYYGDVATAMKTYSVTDVMFLYSGDTLLADTSLTDALNAAGAAVESGENASMAGFLDKDEAGGGEETVPQDGDAGTPAEEGEPAQEDGTTGEDAGNEDTEDAG